MLGEFAVPVAYTQKIISHGRICWANEKPPNWAPELYGRPLRYQSTRSDPTRWNFRHRTSRACFYHLRHPFLTLDTLFTLTRRTFILEPHLDALEQDRQ
jgi:hypothetical protein